MKTRTSFFKLMELTDNLNNAKKSGNQEKIELAEKELKYYEKLCLRSEMSLGCRVGGLDEIKTRKN